MTPVDFNSCMILLTVLIAAGYIKPSLKWWQRFLHFGSLLVFLYAFSKGGEFTNTIALVISTPIVIAAMLSVLDEHY